MKYGGMASIGAGSDGCVFDGTFTEEGDFTVEEDVVTKVYPPRYSYVAHNEWKAMELVKAATGGEGVILADGPPKPIATITEEAFDYGTMNNACGTLRTESDAGEVGIVGLVLPRIEGDLNDYAGQVIAAEKFDELDAVFYKLSAANIVHMDVASRNIFYTNDGDLKLYVGDFGSAFDCMAEDFDANIKKYIKRYRLGSNFMGITRMDGIHPVTLLLAIFYEALIHGKKTYTSFMEFVEREKFMSNSRSIAKRTWMCRKIKAIIDELEEAGCWDEDDIEQMKKSYNTLVDTIRVSIEVIIHTFQIKAPTYEDALTSKDFLMKNLQVFLTQLSDRSVLACIRMTYQNREDIDASTIDEFTKNWFPDLTKADEGGKEVVAGGSKCTTRSSDQKPITKWNVATVDELFQDDPRIDEEFPLEPNPEGLQHPPTTAVLNFAKRVGGKKRRKTIRKRRARRTKTSKQK